MSDPHSSASAEAGPSQTARPPAPAFQPASALSRPGPSMGSLRNAAGSGSNGDAGSGASGTSSDAPTGAVGASDSGATSEAPVAPAAPVPVKPVHRSASSKNAIVYSAVQRRNPVLHSIKNVPTEIGDIPADYQVGIHNGVLFLSLKYHRLHPEYIHQRIEKMKNIYSLRILMILCDVVSERSYINLLGTGESPKLKKGQSEHQQSLRELTKIAVINELSTFVAWSNDEIAQYLTTFKQYEHKSADTLKERVHQTYHDQMQHVLTSGKKVNKADADNLASQFGSFAAISRQGPKALAGVKGLGPTKVTSLVEAFSKPFLVGGLKRPREGSNISSQVKGSQAKVPAVAEAGISRDVSEGRKKQASTLRRRSPQDEQDDAEAENIGSPDWPPNPSDEDDDENAENGDNDNDNDDDDDDEQNDRGEVGRSRSSQVKDLVSGRSPGLSPEPRGGGGESDIADSGGGGDEAWRDPLELGEEEEEGADTGDEGDAGVKRKRTS